MKPRPIYMERAARFYEVQLEGAEVHLRWGRIGAAGRRWTVVCENMALARSVVRRRIAQQLRRGYERRGQPSAPPVPPTAPMDPRQEPLWK